MLQEVGRGRGGCFAVGGGVQVAVGKDDAVFVVAAYAGGVVGHQEGENGRRLGTAGDCVAGGDEVVVFGIE